MESLRPISLVGVIVSTSLLLRTAPQPYGVQQTMVLTDTLAPPTQPLGTFTNPTVVRVGADGTVYVVDRDDHRLEAFTADGGGLAQWGGLGSEQGRFVGLDQMIVAPNGLVYVGDHRSFVGGAPIERVQRFSRLGEYVDTLAVPVMPDAIGPDLTMYRIVQDNGVIERLSSDGLKRGEWGGRGDGAGEFGGYIALAVTDTGIVYVADSGHRRISRFSPEGAFIDSWEATIPGVAPIEGDLSIEVGGANVYIIGSRDDLSRPIVQRFDREGRYLNTVSMPGTMVPPLTFAAAPDGFLYVCSQGSARVMRMTPWGEVVAAWGEWPKTTPFWNINGLSITSRNTLLVKTSSTLLELGMAGEALGAIDVTQIVSTDGQEAYFVPGPTTNDSDGQMHVIVASPAARSQAESGTQYSLVRINFNGSVTGRYVIDTVGGSYGTELTPVPAIASLSSGDLLVFNKRLNRIQFLDDEYRVYRSWAVNGPGTSIKDYDARLAVSTSGAICILQYWSNDEDGLQRQFAEMLVYDESGQLKRTWHVDEQDVSQGHNGDNYYDLATGPDGVLYVATRHGFGFSSYGDVRIFAESGILTDEFGRLGYDNFSRGSSLAFHPIALSVSEVGRLAVADQLPDGQAMIRLFDRRQDDRWRLRVYDNGSLLGLPYDAHMIAAEAVDYTTNDLPDGLRDGPVSIRAERLLAAEAGSYRMSVESHGGVRLWVGDRLLLDSWHAERVSSKQDIDLMPGYYPLVLELHGETNDLNIHLGGWRVRMLYVAYLPSVSDSE